MGQGPGHGGAMFFVCVGQMSTIFSCSVHQKDVAESKDS